MKTVATTSSEDKERKLKDLGADEVINYREINEWGEEAKRLNGRFGVDITLDVGGAKNIEQRYCSLP